MMMRRKNLLNRGRSRAKPIRANDVLRWAGLAILTVACLLLMSPGAKAAPLNLTAGFPDFTTSTVNYSYTAATGELTISGLVASYTEDPGGTIVNEQVTNKSGSEVEAFDLVVTLDGSGNVLSGSFYIDGVVRGNPFPNIIYDGFLHPSGHLLSGDINDFGWAGTGSNGGAILEFSFGNADGLIADGPLLEDGNGPYFGGGMIFTLSNSTLGGDNFDALFLTQDWTGTGFGDVFVPVPGAIWLFGSGLLGLVGVARRRRQ